MPTSRELGALRQAIQSLIEDKEFTKVDAQAVLDVIRVDGIDQVEANEVVETLTFALRESSDSLDLGSLTTHEAVDHLLGALQEAGKLPGPDFSNALSRGYVQLLKSRNDTGGLATRSTSFDGRNITLGRDGDLAVGGMRPVVDLTAPSDTLLNGLWALSRESKLSAVEGDEIARKAQSEFCRELVSQLNAAVAIVEDAPGKFRRHQAITASIGALVAMRSSWDRETTGALLELYPKLTSPLQESLIMRAVSSDEGSMNLAAEHRQIVGQMVFPQSSDELLKAYDSLQAQTIRAGYKVVRGAAAEFGLSALCFAKNQAAVDNILEGMNHWDKLLAGRHQNWQTGEIALMNGALEAYVEKYPQVVYVFGTFKKNAPNQVAQITSERAAESVLPGLRQRPARFHKHVLTEDQAAFIEGILGNVRDEASIAKMAACLDEVKTLFPNYPGDAMAPAAFELFQKHAQAYQALADSTQDGKLTYSDFQKEFKERVYEVRRVVQPVLQVLNSGEPSFNGIGLSAEAAAYLRGELATSLRSDMTIDNLGFAIRVLGDARGGKIQGESLVELQGIIRDYKSNWEGESFFDYNKLERIVSYAVAGREVPLCSINGVPSGIGSFYDAVATEVSKKIDDTALMHPWMRERYGFRAKMAIEVLDVVAEQTLRLEGPVAQLRSKYPGSQIVVEFTGRDGEHEQFVYCVQSRGRIKKRFVQGSDGKLGKYRSHYEPIFRAMIGEDGQIDVRVDDRIKMHRYPIQNSYGVGDFIDLPYTDDDALEVHNKGETFQTRSKLVKARITGFTATGDYSVSYFTPSGEQHSATVSLSAIRRANNPHWFKPRGDYFSDVQINIRNDRELKSFLDGAMPIIEAILPTRKRATMSVSELAAAQKECIKALMEYTKDSMVYPKSKKSNPDEAARRYHELVDGRGRFPLGELIKIERGVCRHQCILEHLLLQQAGIDSRLSSGAANTSGNKFRGFHIWCEVTLADGERFLSDQTWSDVAIPLWSGAYSVDKRRVEMHYRTQRYDRNLVIG